MKNKITLRGLRDGAMMTALTVIFMLLSLYVPFFSYIGMFLSGIPLAALYQRDGLAPSVCAAVCSVLIMFAITGEIFNVFVLAVAFAVPGLVAGICLKKKYNFFFSVIFTGAAFLVGLLLEILMIKLFMGGIENMFSEFFNGIKVLLEETLKTNSAVDVNDAIKTLMDAVIYTTKLYLPAILIVSSLFSAYVMYTVSAFILKKLRLSKVNTVPFYMLRAPRSMSSAAVILYIISFFLQPESIISAAFYNIIFVIYSFVAFCGFSLVDYKFRSVIKKGFIRAIIYILILLFGGLFISMMLNICIILGILDSSLNFRKISAIDEDN